LSDAYVKAAESVRASALRAWRAAGSPAGIDFATVLERAIQTVVQARQSVLERWPVGSDEEIAQARAAANRGEGLDLDEAFAEIAGVDVAAWRQRVEESRQGRKD
jgi:hypothetical protein